MLKICYVSKDGLPELIFQGDVSLAQMEHAFDSACTAPGFPEGTGMLVDVSQVAETRTEDEIRELAAFLSSKTDHLGERIAVVVSPSDPAHWGTARMLSAYAEPEGMAVGVFTSLERAIEWLHSARE